MVKTFHFPYSPGVVWTAKVNNKVRNKGEPAYWAQAPSPPPPSKREYDAGRDPFFGVPLPSFAYLIFPRAFAFLPSRGGGG